MKEWYEFLFENYAKTYDSEIFVKGTVGKCTFIEKEISFNESVKIIYIGAKLEAFSRNNKHTPEDFEMFVIAEK